MKNVDAGNDFWTSQDIQKIYILSNLSLWFLLLLQRFHSSFIDCCWMLNRFPNSVRFFISWLCPHLYRMLQRQVSREVVDGGSVHVWLDLTSKIQSFLLVCSPCWNSSDSSQFHWMATDSLVQVKVEIRKVQNPLGNVVINVTLCIHLKFQLQLLIFAVAAFSRSTNCPYAAEEASRGLSGTNVSITQHIQ